MRSIKNETNLYGKKILLRLDLNVPLSNGKISDTTRIDKILPTLNFLIQKKTKIIILSHVGRPKGKVVKELSLRPIAENLKKKMLSGMDDIALTLSQKELIERFEAMHRENQPWLFRE